MVAVIGIDRRRCSKWEHESKVHDRFLLLYDSDSNLDRCNERRWRDQSDVSRGKGFVHRSFAGVVEAEVRASKFDRIAAVFLLLLQSFRHLA